MLKAALNALTSIHSRPATIKRLGPPDIFSPARITPSNYFRALRGPEYTTIKGAEFIIPLDTLTGQFTEILTFSSVPDEGSYKIKYGSTTSPAINFGTSASALQTLLRANILDLQYVLVTGSELVGFTLTFQGFDTEPSLIEIVDNTLEADSEAITTSISRSMAAWSNYPKRGDRIIDSSSTWAIDEVVPIHDLGARVMALRVRCD